MATAASLTELTTCSICLELFDSPKSLPCLHAFCLKCLQSCFKDKLPGDKACCPTCRKEFQLPPDGVGGFQHHFIVQQLVDEVQLQERCCSKHTDKQLELYCQDCGENICLMCSAVNHRNHSCIEISEMADSCRLRMIDDDKQILSSISSVHEQSAQAKQDAAEFLSKVEDVKKIVIATGDVVKHSVDDQINGMLMELQSVTSESTAQAESVQEANQLALVTMESFHTHTQELVDKGRSSDITQTACELHNTATELLDNAVTVVKYYPPHVTFTPADVTQAKRLNLIGKLAVTTEEQSGITECCISVIFIKL